MHRRWHGAVVTTLIGLGLPVLTSRAAHAHDCPTAAAGRHFGISFFERADTDHDGGVSRQELVASELERFDVFDRNRDGVVTPGEASLGESAWRAQRFDERFRRLDRNGDGVLTLAEGALEPEHFMRLDRDRDGRVTRAELERMFLGRRAARGAPGAGGWTPWGGTAAGVVTRAEAQRLSERQFVTWDTDRDGILTRREVQTGASAARRRVRH